MTLTLAMLRCPDNVAPETRTVAGGEFSIGRGPENDWVLPDPERGLSKRHCVFAFRSGGWQIADTLDQRHLSQSRGGTDRPRPGARSARRRPVVALAPTRSKSTSKPRPCRRMLSPRPIRLRRGAPRRPRCSRSIRSRQPSDRAGPGVATDPLLSGAQGGDPFAAHLGAAAVTLPADFDPLAPDPDERGVPRPDPIRSQRRTSRTRSSPPPPVRSCRTTGTARWRRRRRRARQAPSQSARRTPPRSPPQPLPSRPPRSPLRGRRRTPYRHRPHRDPSRQPR